MWLWGNSLGQLRYNGHCGADLDDEVRMSLADEVSETLMAHNGPLALLACDIVREVKTIAGHSVFNDVGHRFDDARPRFRPECPPSSQGAE